jgi:hypothetical protein
MKKIYILIRVLCIAACSFVCCTQQSYAALSGAYTINPSVAASATNYLTFQSAVSDLFLGTRADGGIPNGTGVSGPVVFNVAAGTYTGQIEFIGAIAGASAVNSVTFEGTDAATRIIEYSSAVTSSRHTIRLESTQYVSFRNLTIRTLGIYGWGIHLNGANTSSIKVKHCVIEMAGAGVTATLPTHVGIIANVSTTNLGIGGAGGPSGIYCDSLEIDSNTIINGYCGIVLWGDISLDQVDNRIRNNRFLNASNWAVYVMFQNGIHVMDNEVRPRNTINTIGYGITIENTTTTTPSTMIVSGNEISDYALFGLNLFNSINMTAAKTKVFNNMISNGYGTGLRLDNCEQMDVFNNSVTLRGAFSWSDDAACYIYAGVGLAVYNNRFSVTEENEILPFFASDPFAFDSMDYNIFYRPDITDKRVLWIDGIFTPTSFVGGYGYNSNSMYKQPSFVNDTNLRVLNSCDKGIPVPFIFEDIDGNARNTPPTIGAHEGIPLRHNLKLNGVEAPTAPIVSGLQDLVVSVQNLGDSIIASFNITYIHNGNTPVTQAWTGTLDPCDTAWVVFTGANQVNLDSINLITVYTSLPNGVADPYMANDTIHPAMYTAMHGHYTIGSSPAASFPAFSDAVQALKLAGVSDSVIFDVEAGTYAEQVSLDEEILGTSDVNTITFDGADASTCIVDYDATGAETYHTFQVGASHVRLRNLTVRASSMDFGWGIWISKNGISDVHVKHCVVDIPNAMASDLFGGIAMNEYPSMYAENDFRADSIEIDSNIIYNGFIGIMHQNSTMNAMFPSERIFIRNNALYNNTQYGILSSKANTLVISNNTIEMDKTQLENVTAITVSYGTGIKIGANTMKNVNNAGINVFYYTNDPLDRGMIANNAVVSSGYDGIYIEETDEMDIVHNSVKLDEVNTFPGVGALRIGGASSAGLVVTNNNMTVAVEGTSAAAFSCDNMFAFTLCDHNNFYKADTGRVSLLDGNWYAKSDLIGAFGLNTNSICVDPEFINDSSLISKNGCMNGVLFAGVSTDINGKVRAAFPDMGAYEISQVGNDLAVISVLTPVFPVDSGMQDLHVIVANRGSNALGTGNVSYRLNGGPVITQPLPVSLPQCDTVIVIFTGANRMNITYGVPNTLSIFTDSPNGSLDSNVVNDTLHIRLGTPMNGAYTIGASGADYVTINEAKNDLNRRGVSGPVVFNIKTGSYPEQVTLTSVNGMSAVNNVTFTSEAHHMDSVQIEHSTISVADNYVIKLLDASNFQLTYLNLRNTGTRGVVCKVSTSNSTVDHCKIECGPSSGTLGLDNGAGVIANDYYTGNQLTITNNIISGSMAGVLLYGYQPQVTAGHIVSNNTVSGFYFAGIYANYNSNLSIKNNTITESSSYFAPNGIYCYNSDTGIQITGNNITMTTGGYGVTMQGCDGTAALPNLVANNVIRITGTKASYGIRNQASSRMRIYHNSVSVNSPVTSYAVYLHYNSTGYRFNEIKNNVFSNTGTGFAMYYHSPVMPTLNGNAVCDYNNLYATGANLVQRGTPSTSYANLNAWRAITATSLNRFDVHSLSYRPGFTSAGNLTPNPSDSASWSLNGRGTQLDSTLISTDINGLSRPNTKLQGAPDIGAIEFTPVSVPPMSVAVPAQPAIGGVQTFFFGSDTVARITWDPGMPVPANITVRYYSGETAPYVSSTALATKSYWSILADTGSYAYNVEVFYADPLIGNLPDEFEMKTAKYVNGTGWSVYQYTTCEADTALNILRTLPAFNEYSMVITGTDNLAPLPVKLISFTAAAKANDVLLSWNTATEVNNKGFVVQRAKVYGQWEDLGFVNGAGNSNTMHQYTFMDYSAFAPEVSSLYYRLKQVDHNGAFTYSPVANVTRKTAITTQLSVYPNPFNDRCSISFDAAEEGQVSVIVHDLQGRVVAKHNAEAVKGNNTIMLDQLSLLQTGVYMLKVQVNEETHVLKMIRQ